MLSQYKKRKIVSICDDNYDNSDNCNNNRDYRNIVIVGLTGKQYLRTKANCEIQVNRLVKTIQSNIGTDASLYIVCNGMILNDNTNVVELHSFDPNTVVLYVISELTRWRILNAQMYRDSTLKLSMRNENKI